MFRFLKHLNAVNLSEFASFYGHWSFVIPLDKPEIVDLKTSSFTNTNCQGDIISFNCSADANPSVTSYQLFENETAILDTNHQECGTGNCQPGECSCTNVWPTTT